LQSVTHTGYAADGVTTLAEPAVTFGGKGMFNRVDWNGNTAVPPMVHYRLNQIANGTGGETDVTYSDPACPSGLTPVPDSNPYRCFPQYFTLDPNNSVLGSGFGWFQKYVVTGVSNKDLTGGSPPEVWSYGYSTGGTSDPSLWRHDTAETTTLEFRTWSQWMGYPTVTVTHGASGGPQSVTTSTYYRGADGDGEASTDNQSMVWNSRRVGVPTPMGTPNLVAGISGVGAKCLDITGGGTADGTNIDLWDCLPNHPNEVFVARLDTNKQPVLVNPQTGKCVDLAGFGTGNLTNVQLWTCTNATNQIWRRRPDGGWQNPVSGRCMAISGGGLANGTDVLLWDCNGEPSQIWQPRDDGTMVTPQANRCVDLAAFGTTNGTQVQSWNCTNATNQMWRPGDHSSLVNPVSGRCMGTVTSGTPAVTVAQLADCTGAANQSWEPQADGTLRNTSAGQCLDATANPTDGTQLQLAACTGGISQQFQNLIPDLDGTTGFLRQQDTLDGTTVLTSEYHTPTTTLTGTRATPAAGGQDLTAVMVTETDAQSRTLLQVTNTWRWTDTQATYNTYGLPTLVKDLNDTATNNDDTCTTTGYTTPDTTRYLIDYPAQALTTDCAVNPTGADYLAGTQTFYDRSTSDGATPTLGLPTLTNVLKSVSGSAPAWAQASRAEYDANGRGISFYDPLDHLTTTAYTPAAGGPVTSTAVTNPMGWTTTTSFEPGHGTPTSIVDFNGKSTTAQYDPLGRLTKVWLRNRSTGNPDLQYAYTLSNTAPNSVQTLKLGPSGSQIASYEIYDGQMRGRQSQNPAPTANGGRNIVDTTYDSRGLTGKISTFWNNTSTPNGALASFADADVPTQHRVSYDNLERPITDAFYSHNTQQWQTTTRYQGDRTAVTPPAGGTTAQTLVDARGNTTALRQFTTTDLNGTFQATTYTYDRLNRQTSITDSTGNQWTQQYDLRGRVISSADPDSGTTTNTYDDAGQLLTTTDARPVTLAYAYDSLGRKTNEYVGSASGTPFASWAYDTLAKGQLTSSTVTRGSGTWTTTVTGYDDAYRPLGNTLTAPPGAGAALAKDWTTGTTYNVDGSTATSTYPAAGGLGAETVTYGYDANGYQLTAAGADPYVANTTYQPWGDVYQRTLGAAAGAKRVQVTTDEYPDTHRLNTIQVTTEHSGTPGSFDEQLTQKYTWDPAGELTTIDNQHSGATTDSQCFTYDNLQRLTSAYTTTPNQGACTSTPTAANVGGSDAYWQTYTYDPTGNRTTLTQHGLAGAADAVTTSTYPTGTVAQPHTLTATNTTGSASGSSAYTYDNSGRTKTSTVNGLATSYTWTNDGFFNQATTHPVTGDQAYTYTYDANGTELLRITPTGRTLYLGPTDITTNADGSAITNTTRYYSCGGTIIASRNNPGDLTWQANDQQGTAQIAVNATTLSATSRKQDPFGNPRGPTVGWPNPHGFVGGTTDEPGGLVHLGARFYDPATGRFLNDDPVTNTTDPQSLNGYAYAGNNPTTTSDPSGRCPADRCGGYGQNPGLTIGKHSYSGPNGRRGDDYLPAAPNEGAMGHRAEGSDRTQQDGGRQRRRTRRRRSSKKGKGEVRFRHRHGDSRRPDFLEGATIIPQRREDPGSSLSEGRGTGARRVH
jgi:RHS repeat-associated protein